jgi:hypothetical protein
MEAPPTAPHPSVAGRRLHRPRQGRRLGGGGAGLDGRDRTPPAKAGPGGSDDEVGQGVGQRGHFDQPEEAAVPGRSQAILAEEVGCGANLLVVGPEQEAEQGLREATGERRSLHLHSDEPNYGQEIGTLVMLFGRFQGEVRRIRHLSNRESTRWRDFV